MKLEDASGNFRADFREYTSERKMPRLNFDSRTMPPYPACLTAAPGSCPFAPSTIHRSSSLRREVSKHLTPQSFHVELSCSQLCLAQAPPDKRGFCEGCRVEYHQGLELHRQSASHRTYAQSVGISYCS